MTSRAVKPRFDSHFDCSLGKLEPGSMVLLSLASTPCFCVIAVPFPELHVSLPFPLPIAESSGLPSLRSLPIRSLPRFPGSSLFYYLSPLDCPVGQGWCGTRLAPVPGMLFTSTFVYVPHLKSLQNPMKFRSLWFNPSFRMSEQRLCGEGQGWEGGEP